MSLEGQIFLWVWCKNFRNENLRENLENLSQLWWYTFHKYGNLGFGTIYKDGLCPKLQKKKPYKAKIGPSQCFILYFMSFFEEWQNYWNLLFLVKNQLQNPILFYIVREYCIFRIYIFTMKICHYLQYDVKGWPKTNLCTELWTLLYLEMIKCQKVNKFWIFFQLFLKDNGLQIRIN